MPSFNQVIIMGHLTRDPEITYTPKGTAVAEVSVAANRNWTTADGAKREDVCFVDVVFWEKKAELLGQYKKKGDCIQVVGYLEQQSWEDKQTGTKRSKLRVVANQLIFIPRAEQQGPPRERQPAARPQTQQAAPKRSGLDDFDDDNAPPF